MLCHAALSGRSAGACLPGRGSITLLLALHAVPACMGQQAGGTQLSPSFPTPCPLLGRVQGVTPMTWAVLAILLAQPMLAAAPKLRSSLWAARGRICPFTHPRMAALLLCPSPSTRACLFSSPCLSFLGLSNKHHLVCTDGLCPGGISSPRTPLSKQSDSNSLRTWDRGRREVDPSHCCCSYNHAPCNLGA